MLFRSKKQETWTDAEGEGLGNIEAETVVKHLQAEVTKDCQRPPDAGRGLGGPSLTGYRESRTYTLILDSGL